MASSKDLKTLQKEAVSQGWVVNLSNGNHIKWIAPNGKVVFTSNTPSDKRALENMKRDLKSAGLVLIKKNRRK